jgi:hypothetical protein
LKLLQQAVGFVLQQLQLLQSRTNIWLQWQLLQSRTNSWLQLQLLQS